MKKITDLNFVKNSAMIIAQLKDLIIDPNFVEKHKKEAKHFIRDRILTFKAVILFQMNILKESVQSELDGFYKRIELSDTKIHKVTNSGFTQARAKLNHSAFIELNELQTNLFYKNTEYKTWNGFRLVAVDGSTLYLPSTEKTQNEFGIFEIQENDKKIVLARISEAFDPLNHISIDTCISPYKVSEHTMMIQHLDKMSKGDLNIYDRNYPGFWIYKLHQRRKIEFCMRIQTKGRGKFIEDFVESQDKQVIVDVTCNTKEARQKCEELGLDTEPVKCRLIRIELESGETEVLIVSLLDTYAFPHECFKALYHHRWPVEEDYKLLKFRLELGNFSGKTVEAIYQDFYAKLFMANLTSIIAFDANTEIEDKMVSCKYSYKINWNNAVQNMKESGSLLFIRDNYITILVELHKLFQVNPVSIRPDRTFERNMSRRKHHFSMAYK